LVSLTVAPLLEFRNRVGIGAGVGGGGGDHGGLALEHRDAVGDLLLSQTGHNLYNDNASRIVELSEEMKDE
jgi:hypothetical protein